MNVCGLHDVGQTEIHTTEPPVPKPGALELERVAEKFKGYKSLGNVQTPAELTQFRCRTVWSEIHEPQCLIVFGTKKNCLIGGRSQLVYVYVIGGKSGYSNFGGVALLLRT
jgi:hypothetical protein